MEDRRRWGGSRGSGRVWSCRRLDDNNVRFWRRGCRDRSMNRGPRWKRWRTAPIGVLQRHRKRSTIHMDPLALRTARSSPCTSRQLARLLLFLHRICLANHARRLRAHRPRLAQTGFLVLELDLDRLVPLLGALGQRAAVGRQRRRRRRRPPRRVPAVGDRDRVDALGRPAGERREGLVGVAKQRVSVPARN